MSKNGNGKNGNYTCQQFIDAIPGTGGIVSEIAKKVKCAWNTAKKYIEGHPTVKQAWENERSRITDRAKSHIIVAIEDGDLQTSKWWVQVMDDDFKPSQRLEHTGAVVIEYVNDWRRSGTE